MLHGVSFEASVTVTRVRLGIAVESGLCSWLCGEAEGVPTQKRPNLFKVASRPMSSRKRGNFLEGKTCVGKTGWSLQSNAEFRNAWNMYEASVVLPA